MMQDERDSGMGVLLQILGGRQDLQTGEVSRFSETIIRLAGMHKVSYPLLKYMQDHPGDFSDDQAEKLAVRCRRNAVRSLTQLHEMIRVTGNLEKSGATVVAVKGPQLARMLYGREALKESVDLDLMLVREAGTDRAYTRLKELGYMQSDLDQHTGRISRKIFLTAKRELDFLNPENGCRIDLHVRPGSNAYLTARFFKGFFADLETYDLEGSPVWVLPTEQYLVYLCYHGGLHQFSLLGWLLDIRTFLEVKRDKLDLEKIVRLARGIRAERSLFLALRLLNTCFGDEIPAVLEKRIPRNWRMRFLVKHCLRMLPRESGYGFTLPGRFGKLVYTMVLIRGIAGRIDLLFGIFMRMVAGWLQKSTPAP